MNKILNFFKSGSCKTTLEYLPTPLAIIFERFKFVVLNNILDFSLIKELIIFLFNAVKSTSSEEYTITDLFIVFRKYVKRTFREINIEINKEFNLTRYYQIINLTIFWNILILNMHKVYELNNINISGKNFYEIFFEKDCYFMRTLKKVINYVRSTESQTELMKLISNIFADNGEVKEILYNSKFNLEDLYEYNKKYFLNVIPEMNDNVLSLNEITSSIYSKLLENIVNIDFNYESIFSGAKTTNFCLNEDKPLIKSMFCQSILRIVFSEEKYRYITNPQYEVTFFKNLVKKCVNFYFEKFGDNLNCLFRREEIYDDLIKYSFYTNANSLYNKCYLNHLKKLMDKYSSDDKTTDIVFLSHEEFLLFYEELLESLKLFTPSSIKIILKLIHENVLNLYSNQSSDNFSPVLTTLFFNFFISPKIQEIYNLSPMKNPLVKNLNRVIRNICFCQKFNEDDPLKYYNVLIDICHIHTKSSVSKLINFPVDDDMDFLLKTEMSNNSKTIAFPSYLFYFDSDYILNVLEISMNFTNSMFDISKEKYFIEKMMQQKKNSFYIKFNYDDFKKLKILDKVEEENDDEEGYVPLEDDIKFSVAKSSVDNFL